MIYLHFHLDNLIYLHYHFDNLTCLHFRLDNSLVYLNSAMMADYVYDYENIVLILFDDNAYFRIVTKILNGT